VAAAVATAVAAAVAGVIDRPSNEIRGIEGSALAAPRSPSYRHRTRNSPARPPMALFPPMMYTRKREPALETLMNSTHYYHTQPKPVSTRARCPVCNQAAYSLAGIHPQCAERQADPPRPKVKTPEAAGLSSEGAGGEVIAAAAEAPAAVKRMPYGRGRRAFTAK
jgi:hypothetical protein